MFGSKSTVSHRIICCSEKEGLFYISGTNHELEYMQIINYDTMILRKQENCYPYNHKINTNKLN